MKKLLLSIGAIILGLGAFADEVTNSSIVAKVAGSNKAVTVNYDLTDDDYKTIGNGLYSKENTAEENDAANAIKYNRYFDQSSCYPMEYAVAWFLNQENSNFKDYDIGSKVLVGLAVAQGKPEEISKISTAQRLNLASASEINNIPSLLKFNFPNAEDGTYSIVSYAGTKAMTSVSNMFRSTGFTTRADYWTPSYALSQIAGGFEGDATVGGYIISISDVSTSYGNATYVIADNASDSEGLTVYRGYYLDGEKFTSEDQIKVGDFVVVSGILVNYNGTTPEFTSGSKIVSMNNPSDGSGLDDNDSESTYIPAQNWIYFYDGSAWIEVENATVLQPQDYAEMGFSVNELSNPEFYLPIYMKLTYPYAEPVSEMFVAYNLTSSGCQCNLLLYDGLTWTVNDNYLQDRVAEFVKTSSGYQFRKYMGEEIYIPFTQNDIQMNAGYLLVADGYDYYAGPVTPTSGYFGYMYPKEFTPDSEDGFITLPNADNTFTFLTEIEINGTTYKTPEGKFLIQQADGNFIYLSGPNYYNFGIQSEPYYSTYNGEFKDSYLWGAEKQEDGTWMIYCDYEYNGEMYHKVIYYSDIYQNFANYTDDQLVTHLDGVMLKLYISENFVSEAPEGILTVAEALQWIEGGYSGYAIVQGYVTSISEINVHDGNATYIISDDSSASNGLLVYKGYSLNGKRFQAENEIKVGDLVEVEGIILNNNGTFEFSSGSKIISNSAGIEGIATDVNAPVVIYNLQGVRVTKPAKGQIYIINGKKVVY